MGWHCLSLLQYSTGIFVTVPTLKAIAAMSLNRVIGNAGKIPWHVPEDFKWFKQITMGHVLVMGRKTFESIGRPLPGRETIILSQNGFSYPGVCTLRELTDIRLESDTRTIFICGGAQIYEQYLPLCSELYLTLVKRTVDGDAFFPAFEDKFELAEQMYDGTDFSINRYHHL